MPGRRRSHVASIRAETGVRSLVRFVRRVVPAPVRRIIRRVLPARAPSARAAGLQANPPLSYPDDVADPDALRELLRDTDLFGDAVAEADGYLADALERFRVTMALLPEVPRGGRLLELGSNPYFLTRLLLDRGLDVTCANWFGPASGFGDRGVQLVRGERSGWEHEFEFDHFNIEADRFPYPDGSFDVVLCCEILEHLPTDPTHMLAEIHRVLKKPQGALLLTTPNAIRLDNLLRMTSGRNVYENLSGYGVYGRHNREYTVGELRDFLTAAGFEIDEVFARDVHPPPGDPGHLIGVTSMVDRGDNLFALARAVGEERWPYPTWLYQSHHAYRRIVRPDLVVGVNDDLQSDGFHEETDIPVKRRWTGPNGVRADLRPAAGATSLVIEGVAPPPVAGMPIELQARWCGNEARWEITSDGQPFRVNAECPPLDGSPVRVDLSTARTWQPPSADGADGRKLGVAIERVAVQN